MSTEPKIAEVAELPKPVEKSAVPNAKIAEVKPDVQDKLRREIMFTFEYDSPFEGRVLSGTFTARRLAVGPYSQFKVEYARLNGGQILLDDETRFTNYQLAFLRYALTSVPPWWDPENFLDRDVLLAVFDFVRLWESSFRK